MRSGRSGAASFLRLPTLPFILATTAFVALRRPLCTGVFAYNSMMSFTTQRDGKGTITVSPKRETDQSALLVISHGLGDTAEGFVDAAERLARKMPYLKIVLPTAPTQPVTMNMGMSMPSWYDIVGLDERSNEKCKGIEESQAKILNILDTEHQSTGLPYSRMALMGFSQGGALSLFTGMQMKSAEQKLAGIVVLSGYVPSLGSFKLTPGIEDTPILHCHGTQDPLVVYPIAQKTEMKMKEIGVKNYELKSFPIQHTVSIEEIVLVEKFLAGRLPPDDSCKVILKEPKDMSVKELRAAIRKAGIGHKAVGLMEKSEFIRLVEDHRDGKL